jgi:hypothetical protein
MREFRQFRLVEKNMRIQISTTVHARDIDTIQLCENTGDMVVTCHGGDQVHLSVSDVLLGDLVMQGIKRLRNIALEHGHLANDIMQAARE